MLKGVRKIITVSDFKMIIKISFLTKANNLISKTPLVVPRIQTKELTERLLPNHSIIMTSLYQKVFSNSSVQANRRDRVI